MQHKLNIITLTAGRPKAFELCKLWGERTIAALRRSVNDDLEIRWIVIDGGQEKVTPSSGQEYHARDGEENLTLNFLGNLSAALKLIGEEPTVFLEDDDYYAEEYLPVIWRALNLSESTQVVGENKARYYNLAIGGYYENTNIQNASLCSTAIKGKGVEVFRALVASAKNAFVDLELWNSGKLTNKVILPHSGPDGRSLVVGMKGLPGRRGIGIGHQERFFGAKRDTTGKILRRWLGKQDAAVYADLAKEIPGRAG